MIELFQHQKEGIEFLKERDRAILADEMGLGKTRQAIIAVKDSVENQQGSVLVVCPASLKINWQREIHMIYPKDQVQVLQSGPEKSIEQDSWVVINYDMLSKYKGQILAMVATGQITAAIVDEAHYIKGKKTIRAQATLEVVDSIPRVYLLTGTPIMNRPIELFNLLKAVKHPLSRARTVYAKRYCGAYLKTIIRKGGRIMRFMDESGATHLPELREMIKPVFLRRLKKDVLDLPAKIISIRVHEMGKEWQQAYDNAWENYIAWVAAHPFEGKSVENILNAQHLVELTKLKQVCSQAKASQIAEDIQEAVDAGEKVVIFSQFTQTIEMIAEAAKQVKYDTGKTNGFGAPILKNIRVVTLTGQDKMDARQESVDRFEKDPETKVFVLNIKAGGVGLNLTAGSIVMFADMDWSPEVHNQAEDRTHRIGQEGTVNVYYYVLKDTIEEDIIDILGRKKEIIKSVMEERELEGMEASMAKEFMERLSSKLGYPQKR
jgi:SWI/SNF-related matrix-associated actin-dependent regulator 1 of chromatin subfamily A